jgi:GAF domain-containing protein/HAMP domain-containing protein
MEQQEVVAGITNSLIVNLSVGGFSVLLVFFIVFTTAQTISRPIVELAQNATSLAGGELAVRAQMNRKDEIGTLANSFNAMAAELQTLVRTLEEQVTERTQAFEKQTNYLRVASEVARDSANAKNLDDLLNQASALVMNRFGFYHTGIFLLDDDQEYAILRASPTEAGQEMLQRRHKLKVGQVGIVGYAAATGVPRIALDTGKDVAYFNNPLLPQTRSEAAIPLKANEKTIGILDVQSTEPDAFTPDDISTLQIMADQLALAIERVQLLETMQQNYEELQSAYQRFTRESWQGFELDEDFKPGYHYDGVKITPLETYPLPTRSLLQRGRAVILPQRDTAKETQVAAPIKLREQVIGVLAITFASDEVTKDVLEMIEETANRLAVSLENARLYTETQKLVERERAVSEISSQITTSFNIENILRTAVMEIGRLAPDAEVSVQLEQEKRA